MLHIRPALPADFPTIQHLAHRIWPVAYAAILSPEQLQYMLEQFYSLPALNEQTASGHRFLVLEDEGVAQGFASYGPMDASASWKLHKLYVLPEKQGLGLGRLLLDAVEENLKNSGAKRVLLNVNRFNPALRFYERVGFAIVCSEDIDIGSGYFMNDYVLEKQLTRNDF